MADDKDTFKVTDRRLFNPDGSPRDVPPEERPEPEAPKSPVITTSDTAAAEPASAVSGAAGSTSATRPREPDRDTRDEADARDPASFANFLVSLASNAAAALGMMEHPVTGEREVDLELAKHWIDVLGMLQSKTRGNLTTQESQILEGILADLRMQFISLSGASPPPKARGFSGRDIVGGK